MLRVPFFGARLLRKTKFLKLILAGKVRCLVTVVDKSSYLHCHGKEPLVYKTVGTILDEAAEKYGDRTALVADMQNERFTFAEVKEKVEQLASGLLELGVNKGDKVGIWAPNSVEWYIANLALAKCGALSVYLNPAYQGPEIKHCLTSVDVRFLIAADVFKTQNYYRILEEISPEISSSQPGKLRSKTLPRLETIVFISDKEKPGAFRFKDLFEQGTESSKERLKQVEKSIGPEEPSNIQFTSGTTGKPKAATLSHFAIVNNSRLISLIQGFNLKHHILSVLGPFFHAMGSVIGILTCLQHGTTLIVPDYSFNAEKSISCILKEKSSVLLGTPTMYIDLFRKMAEKNVTFDTVEIAMAGGSLCTPELYKDMIDKLGIKRSVWLYGLTESGPVAFMTNPSDGFDRVTTTVGTLMPNVEAKVVDANGVTLPCNTPGELLLRGFLLMDGYWNDPEKTRECITPNHWLRTGDQFIIDETGYGKIVGRIKDLIIRGGENISPLEVEEHIITHPDIVDIQVFGIPDERLGEQVCAALKLKSGATLTKSDVQQYCKGKIAHFKIPYYVYFFDEFPKTASGKIERYKLREKVLEILGKSG